MAQPAPLSTGPCAPWVDSLPCAVEGDDVENIERATLVATEVVWALSGRRYGPGCPVTLRPCLRSVCAPAWLRYPLQYPSVMPCDRITHLLDLGAYLAAPVYDVVSVTVAGVAFGETEWRVEDHRFLRRLDGDPWPRRQDLDLPASEPDTWEVVVRPGLAIPASGITAVEALGCEVLLALRNADDGRCKLPRKARSAVRQSVTVDLIDPAEFLSEGRTGIDEVDRFIMVENPEGLTSPSTVINVDRYVAQRGARR